MPSFRDLKPLNLLAAAGLVSLVAGCGGPPPNGTTVDPISPEQAKAQNQSVSDFYKRNPGVYDAKANSRR